MKKGTKACLVIVIVIVILCLVSVILLINLKICPPAGPWPMPPWCKTSSTNIPSFLPTNTPSATSTPESLTVDFTVTVPYWSEGDIFLGVGDNPAYMKLTPINEAIYHGTAILKKGSLYYYSRGTSQSMEIDRDRQIANEKVSDAVLDWKDGSHAYSNPDFQKGFFIGACHFCEVSFTKGNFIEPIGRSMDEIKALGGNSFAIMVYWFIVPDYQGNEIKPIYADEFKGTTGWIHATIQDEDLTTLVNMAHERGLKVYLTLALAPEDWGPGVKGKGDLQPSDPDLFFENYKNYVTHYADLADQTGIEMLSIGSENDTLTQEDLSENSQIDKTAKWREVIKVAREHYSGLLTYSVSCITEDRCGPQLIKFWDDLDVIGWEWYVPIATKEHESITEMKANAERIITNNMQPLYEKYQKPIILTEIGWEAYPGACAHTYGVGPGKGGDRVEQASCYEAVFQAIEDVEYLKGMYAFVWTANLPGDDFPWIWTDAANEVRFSITEDLFSKWFKYYEVP